MTFFTIIDTLTGARIDMPVKDDRLALAREAVEHIVRFEPPGASRLSVSERTNELLVSGIVRSWRGHMICVERSE